MTRIIEVKKNREEVLSKNLEIDIIHNRFDILYGSDFLLLLIDTYYVPVKLEKSVAKVGLYLRKLPYSLLEELFAYIFTKYPFLDSIEVKHSYTPIPGVEKYPYWHIALPPSIEEFDSKLSKRVRYNTKYYPKKLQTERNCILLTERHSTSDASFQYIYVQTYLDWKNKSHNFRFEGSPQSFLSTFGITDCYTLKLKHQNSEEEEILAIGFICDLPSGNVYFENFSSNQNYSKYSVGMILYYQIINDLIKNHKKVFYLSGGNLEYKRHYNGVLTHTYSKSIKNNLPLFQRTFWKILKTFGKERRFNQS